MAKVLAAFLEEPGDDRYGLDLMRVTGLPSGTLYPILVRLERAGCVLTTSESAVFEWTGGAHHPQFRAMSKLVQERMKVIQQ